MPPALRNERLMVQCAAALCACAVAMMSLVEAHASPNLLTNGSFEFWTTGWTSRSAGASVEVSNNIFAYGIPAPPSGSFFCEVEANWLFPTSLPDWIEQTISTTNGERYFASIRATTRAGNNTADSGIIEAAGVSLQSFTTNNTWGTYQASFVASASSTVIRYVSNGSATGYTAPGDSYGFMADDAQVQELTISPASLSTSEDTQLTSTAFEIATNTGSATLTVALSVSNGTLTMLSTTGLTFTVGGNGSASFAFTGTASAINSAFSAGLRYTPNADFNGTDTLTYTATAGANSDTDITPIAVSAVADIVADSVTTNPGTAITFNAITGTNGASADSFENTPTAVSVSLPANGTALASPTTLGEITYTPNPLFTGTDTFTYTVTSGGVNETATVTVTVLPASPSMVIVKTPSTTGPVNAGDVIIYSYRVTNSGNVAITGITVSDVSNATGTLGPIANESLTGDAAPLGDSTDAAANGFWDSLGPGDSVTFTASYTVTQQDIDTLQ
jgi:uncharacterized repeat protein (TIGR01451 family)